MLSLNYKQYKLLARESSFNATSFKNAVRLSKLDKSSFLWWQRLNLLQKPVPRKFHLLDNTYAVPSHLKNAHQSQIHYKRLVPRQSTPLFYKHLKSYKQSPHLSTSLETNTKPHMLQHNEHKTSQILTRYHPSCTQKGLELGHWWRQWTVPWRPITLKDLPASQWTGSKGKNNQVAISKRNSDRQTSIKTL